MIKVTDTQARAFKALHITSGSSRAAMDPKKFRTYIKGKLRSRHFDVKAIWDLQQDPEQLDRLLEKLFAELTKRGMQRLFRDKPASAAAQEASKWMAGVHSGSPKGTWDDHASDPGYLYVSLFRPLGWEAERELGLSHLSVQRPAWVKRATHGLYQADHVVPEGARQRYGVAFVLNDTLSRDIKEAMLQADYAKVIHADQDSSEIDLLVRGAIQRVAADDVLLYPGARSALVDWFAKLPSTIWDSKSPSMDNAMTEARDRYTSVEGAERYIYVLKRKGITSVDLYRKAQAAHGKAYKIQKGNRYLQLLPDDVPDEVLAFYKEQMSSVEEVAQDAAEMAEYLLDQGLSQSAVVSRLQDAYGVSEITPSRRVFAKVPRGLYSAVLLPQSFGPLLRDVAEAVGSAFKHARLSTKSGKVGPPVLKGLWTFARSYVANEGADWEVPLEALRVGLRRGCDEVGLGREEAMRLSSAAQRVVREWLEQEPSMAIANKTDDRTWVVTSGDNVEVGTLTNNGQQGYAARAVFNEPLSSLSSEIWDEVFDWGRGATSQQAFKEALVRRAMLRQMAQLEAWLSPPAPKYVPDVLKLAVVKDHMEIQTLRAGATMESFAAAWTRGMTGDTIRRFFYMSPEVADAYSGTLEAQIGDILTSVPDRLVFDKGGHGSAHLVGPWVLGLSEAFKAYREGRRSLAVSEEGGAYVWAFTPEDGTPGTTLGKSPVQDTAFRNMLVQGSRKGFIMAAIATAVTSAAATYKERGHTAQAARVAAACGLSVVHLSGDDEPFLDNYGSNQCVVVKDFDKQPEAWRRAFIRNLGDIYKSTRVSRPTVFLNSEGLPQTGTLDQSAASAVAEHLGATKILASRIALARIVGRHLVKTLSSLGRRDSPEVLQARGLAVWNEMVHGVIGIEDYLPLFE
jgi:hypothetical protein